MEEKVPTPIEIREHLDTHVIGQDDAKRVLAVAVYNHYKRISYDAVSGGIEIAKSNIIMIGPTGSGKTHIISTLAKKLGVPFVMADATVLVSSNNTGREIENILVNLFQNANQDTAQAERGIVYIDEIDKLVTGINRQKGESIQQALLKFIEGTVATLPYQGTTIKIDTKNILFVVGGAFVALTGIVRMRLADAKALLLTPEEVLEKLTTDDLGRFGLIPEFVGRLPIRVILTGLGREALIDILTKPKNALAEQYKKMFALDGIDLVYGAGTLEKVAELAIGLKTGARGLRTILEDRMRDVMYIAPGEKHLKRIIITPETILKTGKPIFDYGVATQDTPPAPLAPKTALGTTP